MTIVTELTYRNCPIHAIRARKFGHQDIGGRKAPQHNTTVDALEAERKEILRVEIGELVQEPSPEPADKLGSGKSSPSARSARRI